MLLVPNVSVRSAHVKHTTNCGKEMIWLYWKPEIWYSFCIVVALVWKTVVDITEIMATIRPKKVNCTSFMKKMQRPNNRTAKHNIDSIGVLMPNAKYL